uniref:Uncharacterized protein n=1 Tax=Anguilla anguilla TaxID=7936 RepID=A0A0E9VBU3_ANGAN
MHSQVVSHGNMYFLRSLFCIKLVLDELYILKENNSHMQVKQQILKEA